MAKTPVPTLLRVVAAQGAAWAVAWLLGDGITELPEARWLLQGFIASILGRLIGLPYGWAPLNLVLPLVIAHLATTPATA